MKKENSIYYRIPLSDDVVKLLEYMNKTPNECISCINNSIRTFATHIIPKEIILDLVKDTDNLKLYKVYYDNNN